MEEIKVRSLSRNQLKYLAIFAMLLDHVSMFFIANSNPIGWILRVIGRITAPLMCYFLAEGYFYTSSKKKYLIRLAIFAVISQFAYSYAHYNKIFTLDLSMIYTLFISFLVLLAYENIENKILKWISIVLLITVSSLGDWGVIAPLYVLTFWIYRNDLKKKLISFSIISVMVVLMNVGFLIMKNMHWYGELWQLGLFLFIPLLLRYNGQAGHKNTFNKWFFYIFYPAHLIIIALISKLIC